jgi:glycosyltransferase involved in cell wall biosynthesis
MKFSIITACYKGGRHLPGLFERLDKIHGNDADFEWIMVDDFSDDDDRTAGLMRQYRAQARFPVKAIFLEQNHYGVRCVPEGLRVAAGDHAIVLDQDDLLAPDALATFSRLLDKYRDAPDLAGVCGRCVDMKGKLIGTPFKWKDRLSNELDIRHLHKIRGELCQCTRTDLLREFYRDLKPGYTNGHVWTRLARHYRYVYTSEVVRIYDTGNPDSHSNSSTVRYLRNGLEAYLYYINTNADYLRRDWRSCALLMLHASRFARHLGTDFATLTTDMRPEMKLLATLLQPAAALLAAHDCWRGKKFYAGPEVKGRELNARKNAPRLR